MGEAASGASFVIPSPFLNTHLNLGLAAVPLDRWGTARNGNGDSDHNICVFWELNRQVPPVILGWLTLSLCPPAVPTQLNWTGQ